MKRIDKVYLYCEDSTKSYSREMLMTDIDVGSSASEIAEALNLLRNNVSADLNILVKQEKLLKIKGKPTRFLEKKLLSEKLGIHFINQNECSSIQQLLPKERRQMIHSPFSRLIGSDKSLASVIRLAEAAISYPPNGLPTLVVGDSGTGKSLLAEVMFEYGKHEGSFKKESKFVVLNCADYAANPQLLLSQLFGSVKGAYTGAEKNRIGLIEQANDGVLFLDEVHRLPPEGQEMLFVYIDKNEFSRLGETHHRIKSGTLLVAATTENPNSVLLDTFKRRIPVMITMPNLGERSFSERLELIESLYKAESAKVGMALQVSVEVLKSLITYCPKGNIGQLKSDIQLSVARALLEKKKNNLENLTITNDFLSPYVLKTLTQISLEEKREVAILVGMKDYCFGHEDVLAVSAEEFQYDFLTFYDKHKHGTYSIEQAFKDYSQEIARRSILDDNFTFFLNGDIKQIILTISDILYKDLGIIIDKDINTALALYIYNKNEHQLALEPLDSVEISDRVMKATRSIIKTLENENNMFFSNAEVNLLGNIINSCEDTGKKSDVGIVLCAHGDGVATEIAKVVNNLLGQTIVHPVNMGLEISPSDIYQELKRQLSRIAEQNIVLFVDMGSIATFESNLSQETGKKVITIESIDPLLVLETAKNTEYLSMNFKNVIEGIQVCNTRTFERITRRIENYFDSNKKKIVYTVCGTSEGSAQFLKENIKKVFRDLNIFDIEVQAIKGKDAHAIAANLDSKKELQVVAVVGTIDPKLEQVPFISLQEMVLRKGIDKLLLLSGAVVTEERYEKNINEFTKEVVLDMGMESIDKYLYLLSAEKMRKSLESFVLNVEQELKTTFSNNVLLKLFVHTACMIERVLLNGSEVVLQEKKEGKKELAQVIKKAFRRIEVEYNIDISMDECYFIVEIFEK
ncbi:sigma 54-interacting transcriptional regulator [Vagococcus sp. BWB3-3]|uniref:Sigma 54-interacting transcriptional regulator n=1 Tax=Vagococcus allomyrinae TaxID=2794353 RepID=A0A940P3B8_9ENTE|nr:sigma 54-interacting transcriptional regulator [Vagococcus allomyrinae]MBP1040250.1 sigma 54-interacting transcriptional regulator [Vagococcus allomyrinae]